MAIEEKGGEILRAEVAGNTFTEFLPLLSIENIRKAATQLRLAREGQRTRNESFTSTSAHVRSYIHSFRHDF